MYVAAVEDAHDFQEKPTGAEISFSAFREEGGGSGDEQREGYLLMASVRLSQDSVRLNVVFAGTARGVVRGRTTSNVHMDKLSTRTAEFA